MKPTIVCTLPLSQELLERLRSQIKTYEIRQVPCDSSAAVDRCLDPTVEILFTTHAPTTLDHASNLKWVQLLSAGINHILSSPIYACRDILITTSRGIYSVAMAEFTIGLMVCLARDLPKAIALQKQRAWCENSARFEEFPGRELRGLTVGVLGCGSAGVEIARLSQALGMLTIGLRRERGSIEPRYVPTGSKRLRKPVLGRSYFFPEGLPTLLKESDFLVVASAFTQETKNLIDASAIASMKSSACIINISRGEIVDQNALVRALRNREIAGAALDVFAREPLPPDSELYDVPNLIITPHISGVSQNLFDHAVRLFARNLQKYRSKKVLFNVVDRGRGY